MHTPYSTPFGLASRLLLVVLLGLVAWFAFTPSPQGGEPVLGWDKADHVLAFGSLAFVWLKGFPAARVATGASALLGYGAFIEVVQTQIPGRQGSWADLAADALGIVAGFALAHAGHRWRRLGKPG